MSTRASTRFWSYIEHSVDQIVATLDGLEADELNWRPGGAETNSLFVLATHMIGALDETLLGVLCGQPDREELDAVRPRCRVPRLGRDGRQPATRIPCYVRVRAEWATGLRAPFFCEPRSPSSLTALTDEDSWTPFMRR